MGSLPLAPPARSLPTVTVALFVSPFNVDFLCLKLFLLDAHTLRIFMFFYRQSFDHSKIGLFISGKTLYLEIYLSNINIATPVF